MSLAQGSQDTSGRTAPALRRALNALLLTIAMTMTSECLAQLSARDECGTDDTVRALCAAEAQLTRALRGNDANALSQIYADDFQLINYRGTRVNKVGVLNALRSGALRFDSLEVSEINLRVYGGTAVVTGRQHQVAREPGSGEHAHPADVRFTHLYVLMKGTWRLVASQITPIQSARTPS